MFYRQSMLALTIVATAVAVLSAATAVLAVRHAKRSADASEKSVAEAKRSADAAEKSAGAAAITAEADRAEDHRQRRPRLLVAVEPFVAPDGTQAIYRVTNRGTTDIDSVVVHQPIIGEVEGQIIHPVAATGEGDYGETAELGPIVMGSYRRFTLSLGSRAALPEFSVKVVSCVGNEEWAEVVELEAPR